jgi:hypothetical protein
MPRISCERREKAECGTSRLFNLRDRVSLAPGRFNLQSGMPGQTQSGKREGQSRGGDHATAADCSVLRYAVSEGGLKMLHLKGEIATSHLVDAERDRRLALGVVFRGKRIQVREKDRSFITLSSALAQAAIDAGAKPGDHRWHGEDRDFEWITADNSALAMDAQTVLEIPKIAFAFMDSMAVRANELKAQLRAGERIYNVVADSYWP